MQRLLTLILLATTCFCFIPHDTRAVEPTPVAYDPDGISGFELHGGGLMWWSGPGSCDSSSEFFREATVRVRMATPTGGTHPLSRDCAILESELSNPVQDDAYVYYFRTNQLHRKALYLFEASSSGAFPTAPFSPTLTPEQKGSALTLIDGRLYYARYHTASGVVELFSLKTDGSAAPQSMVSISGANAAAKRIERFTYRDGDGHDVSGFAILLENGKLYRYRVAGNVALLATGVTDFAVHTTALTAFPQSILATDIYAAKGVLGTINSGTPPGSVVKINPDTGASTTLYTANLHSQIVAIETDPDRARLSLSAQHVYFTEIPYVCGGIGFCSPQEPRILRNTLPGTDGTWDLLVEAAQDYQGGINLRSDGQYLYLLWDNEISRVKTDAPPTEFDVEALALEVTQAIQNMNGGMRLVARRGAPTTVRGYAYASLNNTSHTNWFPDAALRVFLDGQELPESPFRPVNNGFIDDSSALGILRTDANHSFLFELPPLLPGDLTMTMTVNPDGAVAETGALPYANNTVSLPQPIQVIPSVALGLKVIPVPTAAGTYAMDGGYDNIISRATSLLPIRSIMTSVRAAAWGDDVFFTGDDPPDWDNDALEAIECIRKQTSDGPGSEFAERTHYVGLIHSSVPNFNGLGYRPGGSVIVRMAGGLNGFTSPDAPRGGRTLAHELSHNQGRRHVGCTDSNQQPTNPDLNYPWNWCTIGNGGANDWWGYDYLTQSAIDPNTLVGDLMSYRTLRWPSSHTWSHLFASYQVLAAGQGGGGGGGGDTGRFLFVNGFIRPAQLTATLRPFYAQPSSMIQPAILNEDLYVGSQIPDGPQFASLLFLGAEDKVIGNYTLILQEPTDDPGDRQAFAQWTPLPSDATRIQLVWEGGLLAERAISPHAPQLQLGNLSYDSNNQILHADWTASDADNDPLVSNVYFSPDGGASWELILMNHWALSAAIDARLLPGGAQALLRVSTTDGVHTTTTTSAPFALPDHPPQLMISGITDGERVPYGKGLRLSGLILDPEEPGGMPMEWRLTGPTWGGTTNSSWTLRDLIPGDYQLTLSAEGNDKTPASVERRFTILPMAIPEGAAPSLDGLCNDGTYQHAAFVRVPAGNGNFLPVRITHSGNHLYLSFTGLDANASVARVGVRVDVDGDQSSRAQPGDIAFFVDRDGLPYQEFGNGDGMLPTDMPQLGFSARVAHGRLGGWTAELKIADSLLGGWDHLASIELVAGPHTWPSLANQHQPATWAPVYFGSIAPLGANRPPLANAGSDQVINIANPRRVVLDGGASRDPDGDSISYNWVQLSGPSVNFNALRQQPSFDIQPPAAPTILEFQLTASDNQFTSDPDTVTVHLFPIESTKPAPLLPTLSLRTKEGVSEGIFQGTPDTRYVVMASVDLEKWETILFTKSDASGLVEFRDEDSKKHPVRFYKVVEE